MTIPNALLDVQTACTYAGVAPVTLRVWRHREGWAPLVDPAGRSLYRLDELAAGLARRAERELSRRSA